MEPIGDHKIIPPRGIKNFSGQKRTITSSKNEIKNFFLGEEIKQKETQMGPHRGSQDDPATGDKTKIFVVKSEILIKDKRIKWSPSRKASHLLPGDPGGLELIRN